VRGAITDTAHLSTRVAADALNRRGIMTASGRRWHAMTVLRARDRLGQRGGPCFRGHLRSRRAGACRRRGPDLFAL